MKPKWQIDFNDGSIQVGDEEEGEERDAESLLHFFESSSSSTPFI